MTLEQQTPHSASRCGLVNFDASGIESKELIRDTIIDLSPNLFDQSNIKEICDNYERRFPQIMKLLDNLGIHPIRSCPIPNYFFRDERIHEGHRKNIGLHSLGVALTAERLARGIFKSEKDIYEIVKIALCHDALKRIEIMKQEFDKSEKMGGDLLASDQSFQAVVKKYGLTLHEINFLIKIRDATDSEKFIKNYLKVSPEKASVKLRRGNLKLKVVMLADYMNATSGPSDENMWCKNVTPTEKPIVARWASLYPGLEKVMYLLEPNSKGVVVVNDWSSEHQGIIIGKHLDVQRKVGSLICAELAKRMNLAGDPEQALKDFVNVRNDFC